MTNSIIGTAGHVDHGKTTLIKALTGMETDRLKEEKKRGITIELGFAHMDLPDGSQAGIIDVPGHEKFIRHMLAGAGGIDLVLLIVAADEGIMPQTREHLDILSLLHIKQGIVVLTKADMVDSDWLEFMKEEVAKGLEGTFLENAPLCAVSAYTGAGIDELRQTLFSMLQTGEKQSLDLPFRLPIDRIFSMDGFGAVITGTMLEGTVKLGDNLMVYPKQLPAKVRNIQVHSQNVPVAYAGQRTAINISGVRKSDISRGDILAPEGSLAVTQMIDCVVQVLPHSLRTIKNNSTVHFYHGSRELTCKVILLHQDCVEAGHSAFAQLRFEEPLAAKTGDSFVLRFLSPLETVGGGTILDTLPPKRKRSDPEVLEMMQAKMTGKPSERVASVVSDYITQPAELSELVQRTSLSLEELKKICDKLCQKKELIAVAEHTYIHQKEAQRLKKDALQFLGTFHQQNPLKNGVKREELRTRLRPYMQMQQMDRLFNLLIHQNVLKEKDGIIALAEFEVEVDSQQQKLHDEILNSYVVAGFSPPTTDEVIQKYPKAKKLDALLSKMITDGELVRLTDQIYMTQPHIDRALQMIQPLYEEKKEIILGDVRDCLSTSRKFSLAILEYFDRQKITKKVGDVRHLTKKM